MYQEPTKTGYTIYSKSNCPACVEAKTLLKDATVINCDKYLEEDVDEFLDFIWGVVDLNNKIESRFPSTFPMIFEGKYYIGSLQEIKDSFTLQAEF